MSLDEVMDCMSTALNNTSGTERKMYENVSLFLQTQNHLYKTEAQKYYRRLDREAQARANTYYSVLAQYAR